MDIKSFKHIHCDVIGLSFDIWCCYIVNTGIDIPPVVGVPLIIGVGTPKINGTM